MPPTRRRTKNASQESSSGDAENSDDDIFVAPSQATQKKKKSRQSSQSSQNQRGRNNDESPHQERANREDSHLHANAIKYILAVDFSKVPFTKNKICKDLNCTMRDLNISSINSTLKDVFGYEMVQTDNGSKYMVINTLDNPHLNFSKDVQSRQCLLFLALTHIFMSGGKIQEEALWNFFRQLNIIRENDFNHEYFGDILTLVMIDFVKEKYIDKSKAKSTDVGLDTTEFELTWGERAREEVSCRSILEFASTVYGGRDLKSWPQQYKTMVAGSKKK